MVTFSDCMTLLLTFFVLMLSFSSFKPHTLEGIGSSFGQALPNAGASFQDRREVILRRPQVVTTQRIEKGAQTPALKAEEGNRAKEQRLLEFRNLKVFTVPSADFFIAQGEVISPHGLKILDKLAEYLTARQSRVVVSENAPSGTDEMGLRRAYAVIDYLASKKQLDRKAFSITAASMVPQQRESGRMLEITMLERDVYE